MRTTEATASMAVRISLVVGASSPTQRRRSPIPSRRSCGSTHARSPGRCAVLGTMRYEGDEHSVLGRIRVRRGGSRRWTERPRPVPDIVDRRQSVVLDHPMRQVRHVDGLARDVGIVVDRDPPRAHGTRLPIWIGLARFRCAWPCPCPTCRCLTGRACRRCCEDCPGQGPSSRSRRRSWAWRR